MKLLYAIHYPVFGGPHNQALTLAAPLRERGWETLVLLPDEPGNAAERLRTAGVEVVTMPLHRLRATPDPRVQLAFASRFVREVQGIRHLIRQRHIDLVQVGGLVNPHAAIAARLEGRPVVWQLLDTRAPWPLAASSMALVRALADVVMSTGRSVALSHPGGAALRDRLVPFFPPVDVIAFRPRSDDRPAVRVAWGVPMDAPVVGCVANVNPQKGIIDLVRAFALIRAQVPDARLVLVGAEYATHATYSARVRATIAAMGLLEGRDVVFAGPHEDVERQLAGFDVFAFAPVPRGEGVSTTVLEAMAAGLPVVTMAVGGIPEAIRDGVDGQVVAQGDVGALAQTVVALLTDPVRAAQMGAAARRRAVADFGVDRCAADHVRAYRFATGRRGGARNQRTLPSPIELGNLACPACGGPLVHGDEVLMCAGCSHTYPVVDGIPVLLPYEARAEHDELEHLDVGHIHTALGNAHKQAQAAYFDRSVAEEFEITRPHGTPRLYRFLLQEKFRRATAPIGPRLVGSTALTVCGGSGMDAEFLARAGARVVASDISLAAARRTRARARRYGLNITPVVADVEHLPLADASFDLVLVHDGLHHLERPERGLAEMARVARQWVSVTEPASAAATTLAVRAGVALAREAAGNLVVRLNPEGVADSLRASGFRTLLVQRYAMYYRHQPGALSRLLSRRWVFPLVQVGWRAGNALIGGIGNKMVVVAERTAAEGPVR